MTRINAIGVVVLMISAVGCHPRPGPARPGSVAKEWSMMVREYNISPIFPPREDVQPGDILLLPLPPDLELEMTLLRHNAGGFLPNSVLLHRIDVRRALAKHYEESLSLPATPEFRSIPATQPVPQPTYPTGSFAGDNTRPRLAGFPDALSIQLQSADVGVIVPNEILNVAVAATGSGVKVVKVSLPMVESVGLPAIVFKDAIANDTRQVSFARSLPSTEATDTSARLALRLADLKLLTRPAGGFDKATRLKIEELQRQWEERERRLAKSDPNYKERPFPWVHVVLVTEVYYTRSIDVSVVSESAQAAGANVTPTAALLERLTGVKPAAQPVARPSPRPTSAPAPSEAGATEPASSLESAQHTEQNQLKSLNDHLASKTPGVTLFVTSVTVNGVSMRCVFERPVAIGYRGIAYAIDEANRLTPIGAANTTIPMGRKLPTR